MGQIKQCILVVPGVNAWAREMKLKIGVMGSAEEAQDLHENAQALGKAIASRKVILLTGATTGLVHATGKAAHDSGALHIGISPAHDEREHLEAYALPTDACDAMAPSTNSRLRTMREKLLVA